MTDYGSKPDRHPVTTASRRRGDAGVLRLGLKLLSPLLTVVILVALYYVLPLDRKVDAWVGLELAAGLAIVTALLVWQVRAITSSRHPALRAIQALAVSASVYLLLFAVIYYLLQRATTSSFNATLTRTDALYFTVTVFSTVGFGDIVARSDTARVIVMVQMIGNLIFISLGVRVIFLTAQQRLRQEVAELRADGASRSVAGSLNPRVGDNPGGQRPGA